MIARAKSVNAGPSGSDYIYTYLRTFYRDTSRATGWNNRSSRPWACPTRYGNARVRAS